MSVDSFSPCIRKEWKSDMSQTLASLYLKSKLLLELLKEENGQDLVEYAAVIVLVILALAGGMTTLANGINDAMTTVGSKVNSTL